MQAREYFPLGKAYDGAFCNRVTETEWLVGNLKSNKHSLLVAPRRYGKSSLAEKAIQKSELPFVRVNFHVCTSEAEIGELIVDSVTKLMRKVLGPLENLTHSIKKYLSHLTPKLSFGHDIATLELIPTHTENVALTISESLLLLENLLKEKKKHAVIFFDEFQEISRITRNGGIEGGIRTAAQEMRHVTIIFSGSIRAMLLAMFDDEARPLYRLCRKLKLDRISEADYEKHLNKIAKRTWKKELPPEVFQMIMKCSNRHPYYVNYLCDVIWGRCTHLPTINDVTKAWLNVVEEERSDALRELSGLTLSQRKLLKHLSRNIETALTSKETSHTLDMPSSTIASVVQVLTEKDYVEIVDGKLTVINPLFQTILSEGVVE